VAPHGARSAVGEAGRRICGPTSPCSWPGAFCPIPGSFTFTISKFAHPGRPRTDT
jgi:hypothetical protein